MVKQPSISVNKMAEYITSRGARQRQILKDRKYPDEDFNIGMYHREATDAVVEYLLAGAVDQGPIIARIKQLKQLPADKVGTARRINSNIDALERFQGMLDDIDFKGAELTRGPHHAPKLVIHNVEISVRPEIVLTTEGPKGKVYVGAVKLHFSKQRPHTEESAGYVSAMLQEWCQSHMIADAEIVHPDCCFVIDVASGQVFKGVKATAKRMKDITAECENIAVLWDAI